MKLHLLALVVFLSVSAFGADLFGRINPDSGKFEVTDGFHPPSKGWLPYTDTPPPTFNPARQKIIEVIPPPLVGGTNYVQTWQKKRLTRDERKAIEDAKELAELAEDAKAVLVKLDDEKDLTKEEIAIVLRFLLKMRGLP